MMKSPRHDFMLQARFEQPPETLCKVFFLIRSYEKRNCSLFLRGGTRSIYRYDWTCCEGQSVLNCAGTNPTGELQEGNPENEMKLIWFTLTNRELQNVYEFCPRFLRRRTQNRKTGIDGIQTFAPPLSCVAHHQEG